MDSMEKTQLISGIVDAAMREIVLLESSKNRQKESWLRFDHKVGISKDIRQNVSQIIRQKTRANLFWIDDKNIHLVMPDDEIVPKFR